MYYIVIEKGTLRGLEEEVERLLNEGFKLQGGVSRSKFSYCQAMVKEKEDGR